MQRQVYKLKAGSRANLRCITEDLPLPGPTEVQIEVKAIGLNFADVFTIWGLYGATPSGVFTPGLEFSGIITAKGDEVEGLEIGMTIMGVTRFGAYASHLNIDQRYVIPLPSSWSFAEGASYLVQGLTAYYALFELGNLQENQTVLIHSAAGGVGLLANRMAQMKNAFTIGTVGRDYKLKVLEEEGYQEGIVRSNHFKADLTKALGDRELNIILECIGGDILKVGYEVMAPQGRMVVYGSARYASRGKRPNYFKLVSQYLRRPKIDPQKIIEQNKSVMGFNLIWLYHKADLMHQVLQKMNALELPPPIVGHTFPFEDLDGAVAKFQTGETVGKVVVEVL